MAFGNLTNFVRELHGDYLEQIEKEIDKMNKVSLYQDVPLTTSDSTATTQLYDLKSRLAIRIAKSITDNIRGYTVGDCNLIFDALADGLMKRTEDELLGLIK